ncbi:unnamed protein product [Darwinula stevensoni]|uniref:Uncharacterized protein n=1 Tax=Darwinula stevensoni TaxID=69355 RepID=A0A7R8X9S7_9CRUS|nr:unnamed protein product [Darwinula stevensoni]CAG0889471.1 unnamed protein product [Darwinula stevensoni]
MVVQSIKPWTHQDLQVRSLPDRIRDISRLTHLYPCVPKDDAFGRYYTPVQVELPSTEYIQPMLLTHVPS